ncbi:polyubiquitin [Acrasis kona]|uniref:Polyubiquitin n=1 Tax=Acrasis kona TaxID=1008807 RepID=A0AAW2YWE6_9EUKA
MIRVNIFVNGDHQRENGEVIMVDNSVEFSWPLFLKHCAVQLNLPSAYSKTWKAYTNEGGAIKSQVQLIQNDVLFIAETTEKFKHDVNRNIDARSSPNVEEPSCWPAAIPAELKIQPKVVANEQPEKKTKLNPLVIKVRVINNGSTTTSFDLMLPHRELNVLKLKKKINKIHHIHTSDQTLILSGSVMNDETFLREYFSTPHVGQVFNKTDIKMHECQNVTIFLVVKPLVLYVKNLQGRTIKIEGVGVDSNSTVSKLKEQLYNRCDNFKRLLYNQRVLVDGERLYHYGIHSGCVLYIC